MYVSNKRKKNVQYQDTVRRYDTLQKLNRSTVRWYGTVKGARYVVPGPAPRGGIPGPCPPQMTACAPQTKIVPPKRGPCPEEINRLGATVVQIEA